MAPDDDPFVGSFPGPEGLWIAAGFSGHGLMIAPAHGRLLAQALVGGPPGPLLESFGAGRFDRSPRAPEKRIV